MLKRLTSSIKPDVPKDSVPDAHDKDAAMYQQAKERSSHKPKEHKVIASTVGSSLDPVVASLKAVSATEQGKAFWDTMIAGVPVVLKTLEVFSKAHSFLAIAFVPFKCIFDQETQRRDNHKKRKFLFTKIVDIMIVLLEVKCLEKDDTRMTPDGEETITSRLTHICETMKADIEDCYETLNDQENRWVLVQFAKASSHSKDLADFAGRFTNNREELTFALHLRTAITVEEINTNVNLLRVPTTKEEEMQENMASKFSALDDLREDLQDTLKALTFFKGAHTQVTEEIMSQVWKLQGWDKTVTTSKLVLGIGHYLVEQAKRSRSSKCTSFKPAFLFSNKEMVDYMDNKRLYAVQQALDPDLCGSVSIDEVNEFTRRRPEKWRVASLCDQVQYCLEIEELFGQLLDLTTQVRAENLKCLSDYIETTRPQVSALTSAIERFECAGLENHFDDYIKAQEVELMERLDGIQFRIDSTETVSQVLDGTRIEEAIFILLALLLRRRVAKMHLGLQKQLNSNELRDDAAAIVNIVNVVEGRYVALQEQIQLSQQVSDLKFIEWLQEQVQLSQQVSDLKFIEWLSFGLFKSYLTRNVPAKPTTNDISRSPRPQVPTSGADTQLWYSFLLIDKDGSGQISASELQHALRNANWSPFHRSTVMVLMTLFDNDQHGTIDFYEFAGLWKFIED
ncbi:hypothetical protein B0H19DRAFT_1254141 [Mycena capillaripes]|nr:hypothetical protein B0H19DRAFT_1254141 [Mycena capillaripes]